MSGTGRFFLGFLFALALALCAFIPGLWVGGQTVGDDQGLAGGAIVFFTGILIAGGAFILGVVLAFFLPARTLRLAAMIAGVPAVLVAVFITLGYMNYANESDAFLDEQIINLIPFALNLAHTDATGEPFQEISYDTRQGSFTATSVGGAVCTGTIPAASRDKAELLGALRNVEILLAQSPTACTDGGPVLHQVDFVIEEALPPNTEHSIGITELCLAEHEAIRALVEAANDVYESNRATESCGP